ncbi:hypothetical protein L9F63_017319 [Diploptera punctata]|uniref:Glucosylceramidase n=1 Tax=Diploptera punctata TaxID=6984 RepID=A0AAD7ZZ70_DIPPU|nr:hypothetical protein L9F63_017319 [Diploptera punctata]
MAIICCIAYCLVGYVSGQGCVRKSFGTNRIVCVCNATYCDNLQAPETLLKSGNFLLYTSSQSGKRLSPISYSVSKTAPSSGNVWQVGSCVTYQEMLGFGGAMTDSVGINLGTISETARQNLLNQYFGPNGIGYTFIRNPMGGTDFSTRFYTYDDGDVDKTLSRFSLANEDFKFKLPYLQYIRTLVPNVKIIATPWSPPTWMVESRNGTEGFTRLKDEYYQVLAYYFVNFLSAYKNNGIDIWGVSSQNEPGDGYYVSFGINSCGYSPDEERKFIANNLGPTLRKYGFGNVTIMDGEEQRPEFPEWAETILRDSTANGYVNGTALHWYFDGVASASRFTTLHNDFQDKFILYTESSYLPDIGQPAVSFGNWTRAEILSSDMIDVFNNWVVGWIDWNMALDTAGGPTYLNNYLDSPIIVNATAQEFYKQPIFYALAHFSKFVPPGSKRIQLNPAPKTTLESVAFLRPDNNVAVILLNQNDDDESIVVKTGSDNYMPVTVAAHTLNTLLYTNQ